MGHGCNKSLGGHRVASTPIIFTTVTHWWAGYLVKERWRITRSSDSTVDVHPSKTHSRELEIWIRILSTDDAQTRNIMQSNGFVRTLSRRQNLGRKFQWQVRHRHWLHAGACRHYQCLPMIWYTSSSHSVQTPLCYIRPVAPSRQWLELCQWSS